MVVSLIQLPCLATSFFQRYNITYNEKYKKAQDYGMWVECCKYSKLYCLPEKLLKYRNHNNQISSSSSKEQQYFADMIKLDQVKALGINPNEQQCKIHLSLCKAELNLNIDDESG